MTLPSADELDDADLTAKLWEVLDGLASLGVFLNFTDHLSDRELYVRLWSDTLREPMELQPESDAAWFIDMTGGYNDEGTLVYLKYYADEDARHHWAERYPECPMPARASLPFDRDRRLPQHRWNRAEGQSLDDAVLRKTSD